MTKRTLFLMAFALTLTGCGSNKQDATSIAADDITPTLPGFTIASGSDARIAAITRSVSPFIVIAAFAGTSLDRLASVSYTIESKPGSASKPVFVTYSKQAFDAPRYAAPVWGSRLLPIFGLYANYPNKVQVILTFTDASVQLLPLTIQTKAYADPNGIYDQPEFIKRREPGSKLGFDYFALKSNLGTPVIMDTDGEVRWVGAGIPSGQSSALVGNGFVIGSQTDMTRYRLELDGTSTSTAANTPGAFASFHHNIDPGKNGLMAEITSPDDVEGIISEFTFAGGFGRQWSLSELISRYMVNHGDDPSRFVRPSVDWFHTNATLYDPSDDSIIVSSRENFVIKISYETGDIIWIFGDPSKYWYSFPSLRAKALTLPPGSLYPIGQHAISFTSDGLLMLSNDGAASLNQPTGAPIGNALPYSTVSAYSIDSASGTANEVWRFDHDQTVISSFCSSAYEAFEKSILITYSLADNQTRSQFVGLDASRNVVFDFKLPNKARCDTSWNSVPVHLEQLSYQ